MLSHTLTVGTFSLVFYHGQAGAARQLCVQQLHLSAGQQDGQEARSTMKTSAAASCHLVTENNQMQQRKPEKRKRLHESQLMLGCCFRIPVFSAANGSSSADRSASLLFRNGEFLRNTESSAQSCCATLNVKTRTRGRLPDVRARRKDVRCIERVCLQHGQPERRKNGRGEQTLGSDLASLSLHAAL